MGGTEALRPLPLSNTPLISEHFNIDDIEAIENWNVIIPAIPVGGRAEVTNDWCISFK